jgi:8-oxo-dGTP pyrophosphatase MutT (NUDIX family)
MPTNDLLNLINAVDNVPLPFNPEPFYRLLLGADPRPHGFMSPPVVHQMPWPPVFSINHTARAVTLHPDADPTAAFQAAVDAALARDLFPHVLAGRHSEPFRVLGARGPGLVSLERFAATLFGIATRGAHLTAYTRGPDAAVDAVWCARRSAHLFTFPGKLDSTVAGGVKASDSPLACILAESHEEASLPASLVRPRIAPAGVVSALNLNPRTGLLHGDVVHVFDLDLSPPCPGLDLAPGDDEVEEFLLVPVAELRRHMVDGEFKPNVCLVLIDFLVRHGLVTPETEGEGAYVEICSRLRRRLPMPIVSDE